MWVNAHVYLCLSIHITMCMWIKVKDQMGGIFFNLFKCSLQYFLKRLLNAKLDLSLPTLVLYLQACIIMLSFSFVIVILFWCGFWDSYTVLLTFMASTLQLNHLSTIEYSFEKKQNGKTAATISQIKIWRWILNDRKENEFNICISFLLLCVLAQTAITCFYNPLVYPE